MAKVMGIERSTFIFHNKTLVKSYRKVKAAGHTEQVLEDLKTFKQLNKINKQKASFTLAFCLQSITQYFDFGVS